MNDDPDVSDPDGTSALRAALGQARLGLDEGGVPIGAVLVDGTGTIIGSGRNGSVQYDDHLMHAETAAVRSAGRLSDYAATTLVTTMTPCWYCAGLVRFLGIGSVVVGDGRSWSTEAAEWLADAGVAVSVVDDDGCIELFSSWIATAPAAWTLPESVDGDTGRS
ncbi:MAG: nucleoside deaminase [Ilumatobacteraceae bacterium]|nr:nucleoside deaminase [Ilumatobacteraceae bacterium]